MEEEFGDLPPAQHLTDHEQQAPGDQAGRAEPQTAGQHQRQRRQHEDRGK
jgi:hypothetical protein